MWSTGGPDTQYVVGNHSDKPLRTRFYTQQPGLAPALLQASCVAFESVFIHPAPQFSLPEKMGIIFLYPEGLGG